MLEVVQPHPCPYLDDLESRMRYRWLEDCTAEQYEAMLVRGWRRFGCTFFRPECIGCEECRSLRIDPLTFEPSRSQRRAWTRNQDLKVALRPASMTLEHLDLYEKYHSDMAERRGWDEKNALPEHYFQTFVEGKHSWGHELLFLEGDRLVCVALLDLLPAALSAVYCFYDPDERRRGLGVFSVLVQLDLARRRGIPQVYLGYWVRGNQSMSYKSKYRPHRLLQGRPDSDQKPRWSAVSQDSPGTVSDTALSDTALSDATVSDTALSGNVPGTSSDPVDPT